MTSTYQSIKGFCNLFIEPQLTSFLVWYSFSHVFKIFTAYHLIDDISSARSLDANARNHSSQNDWIYNFINVSTLI